MQEYEVEIGGLVHTVLLSDEEAKRRGLKAKQEKVPVANKARTPRNKTRD